MRLEEGRMNFGSLINKHKSLPTFVAVVWGRESERKMLMSRTDIKLSFYGFIEYGTEYGTKLQPCCEFTVFLDGGTLLLKPIFIDTAKTYNMYSNDVLDEKI